MYQKMSLIVEFHIFLKDIYNRFFQFKKQRVIFNIVQSIKKQFGENKINDIVLDFNITFYISSNEIKKKIIYQRLLMT